MYEWQKQIQIIVDEIDKCVRSYNDEALTLGFLSRRLGYSEFYTTRKFKEISGMQFRDYLRHRKLAFALKEVRDSEKNLLDIAFDYGFSSHEAFSRAFKETYGVAPSEYRKKPKPVVLRTKINPFDRYFLELGEIGMMKSTDDIKIYFITIPAHKFLHIKNYESNGYWDFWQKQSLIPGQDCETICGLLDSIKGKLDDDGGSESNGGSGQIMAYINDPNGRLCDWGIPRIECYGVRLPFNYKGEVPPQMLMINVPEAEYIVFEHGPFNYEQENRSVEEEIEKAMETFDFAATGYCFDTSPGRIIYFYHNPERFFKYIRPVRR
ncbi:MAG TPA: AraC family transcriptional regulator [Sporomusaceae bacterium]|uniref:helix-turn-helix transcriptional regulator n=1 Tax=Anaerospora sp. TaxID=1960278 RepID=UPI000ED76202|nr:helix-turn-helix transcriptional regulator [Anaerospora sp.]HAK74698.1 AraC family transcriptional regulator [Sporomusaceae bacterium]